MADWQAEVISALSEWVPAQCWTVTEDGDLCAEVQDHRHDGAHDVWEATDWGDLQLKLGDLTLADAAADDDWRASAAALVAAADAYNNEHWEVSRG